MNKLFWTSKTRQFKLFRNLYPFKKILEKENDNLKSLLNQTSYQDKIILDIGIGTGNVLQLLSGAQRFFGIDLTYSMLKAAKKDYPDLNLIQADVINMPIKSNSIEVITAVGLIEYLKNIIPVFEEASRVLKKDGWFVLTFSPKNFWSWLRMILGHIIYTRDFDQIKSVAKFCQLEIRATKQSLMQHQLLLKNDT